MSNVSLNGVVSVLPQYIDTRLAVNAPPLVKWLLGGTSYVLTNRFNDFIQPYKSILKTIGILIVDGDKEYLNIDNTETFLKACFAKQDKVTFMGFTFDINDANAFCALLRQVRE